MDSVEVERFACNRCGCRSFYAITSEGEWEFLRCTRCDRTFDLDHWRPGDG